MKILLSLFFSFFKIGLFTFGGGYAMLPLISRVVVQKKQWAAEEELLNFYAIAQCTPGVMAVNTATFIGAKLKGVRGAIIATLGVIAPSVIIITLIAGFLHTFGDNEILQNAFKGVRIAACATVAVSVFKLGMKAVTGIVTGLIAAIAFIFVAFLNISPVLIAPAAGLLGALYAVIALKNEENK